MIMMWSTCPHRKRLSKLAFNRVREARAAFKTYSAKLPHEKRIKLEQKYASQGYFDFKSRTAQVLSSVFLPILTC